MKKSVIKNKNLLFFLILFISIGFAYLSANLNILGSIAYRASTWDIHFEDILVDEELSFDDAVEPTLNQDRDTISMNLNFSKPGDRLVFYVDVVNNGSFDAKLDSINITNNLSSENNKLLDLSVKYLDGITVQENDILLAHNRKVLMISAEYSTNIDVSDLPSSVVNFTAEVNLNYVHLKDYNPIISTFKSPSYFKSLIKYLVTNDSSYLENMDSDSIAREHVTEVTYFKRASELKSGLTDTNNIATEDSANPIYLWFDDDIDTLYWYCESEIISLPSNSNYMFDSFRNLKDLNTLSSFDASDITSASGMFMCCKNIKSLFGLKTWNTSSIENLGDTFDECDNLVDLTGLNYWDVSNCTEFIETFADLINLKDLTALSNWRFGVVDSMHCMFFECYELESLDGLENWNVENVDWMESMFSNCYRLNDISALANWQFTNVESIYSMFESCSSLSNISHLMNWDVSNIDSIANLFYNCTSLSSIDALQNWNVSNVTSMYGTFYNCTSLSSVSALQNWNVSNVTSFGSSIKEGMFENCTGITDATILNGWTINQNATMTNMFLGSGITASTKPTWYTGNI